MLRVHWLRVRRAQGACNDAELSLSLATAIEGALALFVSKSKEVTVRDGDVRAIGGLVNMNQTKNISVYAAAAQLYAALEKAEGTLQHSTALEAAEVYARLRAEVPAMLRIAV